MHPAYLVSAVPGQAALCFKVRHTLPRGIRLETEAEVNGRLHTRWVTFNSWVNATPLCYVRKRYLYFTRKVKLTSNACNGVFWVLNIENEVLMPISIRFQTGLFARPVGKCSRYYCGRCRICGLSKLAWHVLKRNILQINIPRGLWLCWTNLHLPHSDIRLTGQRESQSTCHMHVHVDDLQENTFTN